MNTTEEKSQVITPRTFNYERRPRSLGRFSSVAQTIYASAVFWMNLPRKSILNAPGNRYQPRTPDKSKFKKGPLSSAQVIQKFFDRRGKGFARLSTGTITVTGESQS